MVSKGWIGNWNFISSPLIFNLIFFCLSPAKSIFSTFTSWAWTLRGFKAVTQIFLYIVVKNLRWLQIDRNIKLDFWFFEGNKPKNLTPKNLRQKFHPSKVFHFFLLRGCPRILGCLGWTMKEKSRKEKYLAVNIVKGCRKDSCDCTMRRFA